MLHTEKKLQNPIFYKVESSHYLKNQSCLKGFIVNSDIYNFCS